MRKKKVRAKDNTLRKNNNRFKRRKGKTDDTKVGMARKQKH